MKELNPERYEPRIFLRKSFLRRLLPAQINLPIVRVNWRWINSQKVDKKRFTYLATLIYKYGYLFTKGCPQI